jgi:hypothetical protein
MPPQLACLLACLLPADAASASAAAPQAKIAPAAFEGRRKKRRGSDRLSRSLVVCLREVPAPAGPRAGAGPSSAIATHPHRQAFSLDPTCSPLHANWPAHIHDQMSALSTRGEKRALLRSHVLPALLDAQQSKVVKRLWRQDEQQPWAPWDREAGGKRRFTPESVHGNALALLSWLEDALTAGCRLPQAGGEPSPEHPLMHPLFMREYPYSPVCMPANGKGTTRRGMCNTQQGYLQLQLCAAGRRGGGERRREYAHRLVCWLFHGRPGSRIMEAVHLCGRPNCPSRACQGQAQAQGPACQNALSSSSTLSR